MKIIVIEENDADQRIDKFLKKFFVNATLSLIYKLNRKSKIKVQKAGEEGFKKRTNDFKLGLGDSIKFFMNDGDIAELSKKNIINSSIHGKNDTIFMKKDIVFEDDFLFIVNKNPGVNVHPGDFKSTEVSLIQQVQDYLGESLHSLTFKPSLVHRIDRDTSGILIIAKKKDILSKLVADFKSHSQIKKTYLTVCFGKLPQSSGTITKRIARIDGAKNENKIQISDAGQVAISHYSLVQEMKVMTDNGYQNISIVEVEIETGRMHQIRIHMASIKCPVIGDKTYGNKSLNYYFEKKYGISRQMLHAYKMELYHYGLKKKISITAELKNDMEKFIQKISE